jgi:rhodanese-related sulfurtransferase
MNVNRRLGAGALVLGVAALFAGSPYRRGGKIDVDQLAREIAEGRDHVSARQLGEWIRARKAGLKVIDVRSPAEFAAYSIPGAENVPIEQLSRARFGKADQIVLYSEGGAHAAQAWALLRAMGQADVRFIPGGLADWRDEVIAPVLPAGATPEQTNAFEEIADLSRYFDGTPEIGVPGAPAPAATSNAASQLAAIRRRGC